jgi:hypothetical protein
MGTHIFYLFMIKPTICEDLRLFIFKLLIVLSTSSVGKLKKNLHTCIPVDSPLLLFVISSNPLHTC